MRLSALPRDRVPRHLIAMLEQSGVRTVNDLLFSKPPLELFRRLPPGTNSLSDLINCLDMVAETCSASGTSAIHAIMQAEQVTRLSTSVQGDLLGELTGYGVVEITGGAGSGKTVRCRFLKVGRAPSQFSKTLALNATLLYLLRHANASATWFDTTGNFRAGRASLMLASLSAPVQSHRTPPE